jgi:hypothetical protein
MILLRELALAAFASLFVAAAIHAWRTGRIPVKGGIFSRRRNPVAFWLTVAANLGMAALLLAGISVLKP